MTDASHARLVLAAQRAERRLRDAADWLHTSGYPVSARQMQQAAEDLRAALAPSLTDAVDPPAEIDLTDTNAFEQASRPMEL